MGHLEDPDWSPEPLDILIGYTPGMPLPARYKEEWHPETNYNKPTPESYYYWLYKMRDGRHWGNVKRKFKRQQSSGRRFKKFAIVIRKLIEKGVIDLSDVPDREKLFAEEALTYVASVIKDIKEPTKNRLAAAKEMLTYTKAKPVQKSEVSIKTAEEILDELDD